MYKLEPLKTFFRANYNILPTDSSLEELIEVCSKLQIKDDNKAVINIFCSNMGISFEELKAKTRKHEVLHPRYILMYLLKQNKRNSLQSIGNLFGKDHATVLNALKKVEIYKNDTDFQAYAAKAGIMFK